MTNKTLRCYLDAARIILRHMRLIIVISVSFQIRYLFKLSEAFLKSTKRRWNGGLNSRLTE